MTKKENKAYWKCKKCGTVSMGSIYVTDGYCNVCKEYYLLERYDPLNDVNKSPLD